jgi:hypothetical protein
MVVAATNSPLIDSKTQACHDTPKPGMLIGNAQLKGANSPKRWDSMGALKKLKHELLT